MISGACLAADVRHALRGGLDVGGAAHVHLLRLLLIVLLHLRSGQSTFLLPSVRAPWDIQIFMTPHWRLVQGQPGCVRPALGVSTQQAAGLGQSMPNVATGISHKHCRLQSAALMYLLHAARASWQAQGSSAQPPRPPSKRAAAHRLAGRTREVRRHPQTPPGAGTPRAPRPACPRRTWRAAAPAGAPRGC